MPSVTLTNTLQRGLRVLEAFTPALSKMRLQDVVEKTGFPKVTVLRFLRTLLFLGYVSYDGKSKLYSLSPRVMSLGFTALSGMDLREAALPHLQELSDKTGQNVNLGILDGTEVVYIERIKKRRILNIDLYVGSHLDVYHTSIGHAILAYMNRADCQRTVDLLLKNSEIATYLGPGGKHLYKRLEEVRQKGYAFNDEEYVAGLRAIAAPVFNHEGIVDAGINVPVFAHQVSRQELLQYYVPLLIETAERVSGARGFVVHPSKEASQ